MTYHASSTTFQASPVLRVVIAVLALSGCMSAGPDYVPPQTHVPTRWAAAAGPGLNVDTDDAHILAGWWKTLDEPMLTDLIERAAAGNRDLAQAEARVREARARRGVSEADRFPTLQAGGSATRRRGSEETGSGKTTELYSAGFDATWELDIFGGRRRALESASANLEASEYDLRDVLVSLLAEVALNYVDTRALQTRLSVAEANLRMQSETHDIARWRHEAGLATQRDVEQAKLNLEQTRSQIPALHTGIAQAGNRIAVLLGHNPGPLAGVLAKRRAIPAAPPGVAVGVPADTLRRRPEVQRAERQLAAQTAQIGVATAALYPNFSLVGSIGLEAITAGRLLTAGAMATSVGANIGWTVFDAGRIRQNIAVQTALQEQALARYEAAVLVALQDVENALVAYAAEQQRRDALSAAAAAARSAADLARHQYSAGLVDFQVVLDTQRSLLALEDQLASSQGNETSNLVRLYKALGGGWTPLAPPASNAGELKDKQDGTK